MKKQFQKFFLEFFFPQFCINCQKEGNVVCQDCLSTIEITEFCFCPFCKIPKRVPIGKCKSHQRFYLNGLFFATSYQQPLVQKMIIKFKYEPFLKTLAKPLSLLIISYFNLTKLYKIFLKDNSSCFVPIPLHISREKWRGFNQSFLIAKELSYFFQIPLLNNNLIKIKKTQPQMSLTESERKINLQNAFAIKNPKEFFKKRIFLVDDVFTTGNTMEECAKILKKAGAKEVWGITIAREPLIDRESKQ